MTIKAVFRVQCDGPCHGWLSLPYGYRMGTDIRHENLIVRPTAVTAGLWPGERAARTAALNNGWVPARGSERDWSTAKWLCPTCKLNPLDIRIPKVTPARFAVYGPAKDGEIPYAMIDTDEVARTDTVIRERLEEDVRVRFRELHPGVPIIREVWTS